MSDELFSEEVHFPEDLETMLSMSVHYEKLQSIMRFILDLLKRHEQGLRMAFSKQNVIAPEVLTLHSFKENLEVKFLNLERNLNKTNKSLEEIKQNLESRGDTVGTLKFILNSITEHGSAVLNYKKILAELVAYKDSNEKRMGGLEETFKQLKNENEKLKEEIKENLNTSRSFRKPEENEKPNYKAPTRKYKAKTEGVKAKLDKLEIPKDIISGSPSKKSLKESPKEAQIPLKNIKTEDSVTANETFQLTNPNLPPHLQELFLRIKNIEKAIEFPPGSKEIANRVGKLESMYKFIEQILDSCEPLTIKNRDQIVQVVRSLKNLEKEMVNKLNTEDFDAIKNLVITIASGSNKFDLASTITAKEINTIRLLEKKVCDLETSISDIVKIYPENIEEVVLKLRRIEQKLQVKAGEDQFEILQKSVNELSEKVKNLPTLISKEPTSAASINKPVESSLIKALNRRVSSFEDLFRSLKIPAGLDLTQMWEELKRIWQSAQSLTSNLEAQKKQEKDHRDDLLQRLDKKVEVDSLKFVDEKYKKLLESFSDRCSHQFADKLDMRKGLRYLENLIRQLDANKNKPEGDDAMLAKKPLIGWSCGSCEKKLESLTGRIASHSPWKKLPLRDASERILKAGPGYSKMLSTLQLESLRLKSESEDFPIYFSKNTERSVTPQP